MDPYSRPPAGRRCAIALLAATAAMCAMHAARAQPAATDASAVADVADAATATDAPQRSGGIFVISARRAGTLPTWLPSTVEGVSGAQIAERINATDSEDALKYLPSLLVRKRYIGDYNHAVLSSRASGTGNSARSMVYADGILLSNYLGNGAAFTPRWGLVTPEEIERVDVLYGPFSAAYPGNSVGAVVDYVTRLPRRFEAHVKLGGFVQPFELYNTSETYTGGQASASLGDRIGGFAWWVNVNRLDSQGQPLTFATKAVTATTPAVGTPVDGAVVGLDRFNTRWWIIGAATQYHTVQDHAKVKLGWDGGGEWRLAYTLGWWGNRTRGQSQGYLTRDPANGGDGSPFYTGVASIGGSNYTVTATDFNQTRETLTHWMHGFTAGGRAGESLAWEFSASLYDYAEDLGRTPTVAKPAADTGGAGRITHLEGTGWHTLALKGRWKASAEHALEFGVQHDRYQWRQRIDNAVDWIAGEATTPVSSFAGNTRLTSLHGQDAWRVTPTLHGVLGLRLEQWAAFNGAKSTGVAAPVLFDGRREDWLSPKAALGWQVREDWSLKASTGRAVRAPTVGELFQGNAGADPVTNPGLKPEKSWTSELSSERTFGTARLRTTLFHEDTTDALYSQAIAGTVPIVNSVQNIDRIRTWGLENAFEASDVIVKGLDLQASLTYADSKIVANSSYVAVPGDTLGRQQPRVPKWRASLLATWRVREGLSATFGARYGSSQYGTLNNSDANGFAYQAFSKYFTTDLRLHWKIDRQWSASFGIDNLNNYPYWNFHPYPQRTYSAEVRFDL